MLVPASAILVPVSIGTRRKVSLDEKGSRLLGVSARREPGMEIIGGGSEGSLMSTLVEGML